MSKRDKDTEGWYQVKDNPISKIGVYDYLGSNISPDLIPDKIYKVYRPEAELSSEETINSFKLKPWIIDHKMLGDELDPTDDGEVAGVIGEEVYFNGGVLYANIKAFSKRLRDLIERGVNELSCGYFCDWQIKAGITENGEPFDVIQKNIRGNHLALVDSGRMGKDVAVLDRKMMYENFAFDSKRGEKMEKNKESAQDDDMETRIGVIEDMLKTILERLPDSAEDKVAEDEDKGEVEVAEDEIAEDEVAEDEKSADSYDKSMDSEIKSLSQKVKTLEQVISQKESDSTDHNVKQEMYEISSPIVGAFDHSAMDSQKMGKYICEKVGIALDKKDDPISVAKGYCASKTPANTFTALAQDSNTQNLFKQFGGGN